MNTEMLNKAKVKEVTNASRTATATMIMLGFRQRGHKSTTLSALKQQLVNIDEKVVEKDYREFWKGLEQAGAGSLILGRRGKKTRFKWDYSLKQIAKIAIEGHEGEIKQLAAKKNKAAGEITDAHTNGNGSKEVVEENKKAVVHMSTPRKEEKLVYTIELRPGYVFEINLPADVTKSELQVLADSFLSHKESK